MFNDIGVAPNSQISKTVTLIPFVTTSNSYQVKRGEESKLGSAKTDQSSSAFIV
jgi:hypothetical protein